MIKEAHPLDGLEALRLGEAYANEVGEYAGVSFDPDVALSRMLYAVHDDSQLFLICFKDNKAVGMLWAVCAPILPWSSDLIAVDQILYVDPAYRGTSCGVRLIRKYIKWAEAKGAMEARLSVGSGIHQRRTAEFYNKLGFEDLGSQHRRRIYVSIPEHP